MYPEIFGFLHTYGLCIAIGFVFCFYVVRKCCKVKGINEETISYLENLTIGAIIVGFLSATLFQSVYNFLANPSEGFHFGLNTGMTFIGGLIGGVVSFLLIYFYSKGYEKIKLNQIVMIAPCGITIAHAFGRIGCFFAGCCYGKVTDSIFGVKFPGHIHKVFPTQIYESLFLFCLFGILMYMITKTKNEKTMPTYLICYGIFRCLLEFVRGDDRGTLLSFMTPSQFWSVVMVLIGVGLLLYPIYKNRKKSLND